LGLFSSPLVTVALKKAFNLYESSRPEQSPLRPRKRGRWSIRKWLIDDRVPGAIIGYRAIVDEDDVIICNPSPMGEDKARLIASAPELLACLEECVLQMEQMRAMFDDRDGAIQAALDGAKGAIAKATGGAA
jgi:hypothetical protein